MPHPHNPSGPGMSPEREEGEGSPYVQRALDAPVPQLPGGPRRVALKLVLVVLAILSVDEHEVETPVGESFAVDWAELDTMTHMPRRAIRRVIAALEAAHLIVTEPLTGRDGLRVWLTYGGPR